MFENYKEFVPQKANKIIEKNLAKAVDKNKEQDVNKQQK